MTHNFPALFFLFKKCVPSKIFSVFVVSIGILVYIINEYSSIFFTPSKINYSSVWCTNHMNRSLLCKFSNVCYDPKHLSLLFFLSNSSVIKGIVNYTDLKNIQLSSVNKHNKFVANVSIILIEDKVIKNADVVKKGLLFSRFKPDNVMHIIHDDLIPLYLRMEELCLGDLITCGKDYSLFLHDDHPKGSYFKFYQVFTESDPVLLPKLKKVLCFEKLHTGLMPESTFYQYGFNTIQGPINHTTLDPNDLFRFSNFIKSKFLISGDVKNKSDVILVSRRKSRKIINDQEVIQMLERVYKYWHRLDHEVNVITLDLAESGFESFMHKVAQTSLFAGMHGAEMIFSLFLKPNSTVIEIFPYAIQSDFVSFIKPLSKMKGIHFNYFEWRNVHKNKSIFHPEAQPLYGGINFLPDDVRNKIAEVELVPGVECCNNPMYLHYMYQDTIVEAGFEQFLREAVPSSLESNRLDLKWHFPSVVTTIMCMYNNTHFNISWKPPINVKHQSLVYDLYLMEPESNLQNNIITEKTNLIFSFKLPGGTTKKLFIWITAINKSNGSRSKDVFHECT